MHALRFRAPRVADLWGAHQYINDPLHQWTGKGYAPQPQSECITPMANEGITERLRSLGVDEPIIAVRIGLCPTSLLGLTSMLSGYHEIGQA